MESLETLVAQNFPEEMIIQRARVKFRDTWSSFGSIGVQWYVFPMDMLETDQKFYFDKRQAYLAQAKVGLIIGPLFFRWCFGSCSELPVCSAYWFGFRWY